jgi:hypothetical protein
MAGLPSAQKQQVIKRYCRIRSGCPSEIIFKTFNIILAKIIISLNFNKNYVIRATVFNAMEVSPGNRRNGSTPVYRSANTNIKPPGRFLLWLRPVAYQMVLTGL